jgi:hypothetical protein
MRVIRTNGKGVPVAVEFEGDETNASDDIDELVDLGDRMVDAINSTIISYPELSVRFFEFKAGARLKFVAR